MAGGALWIPPEAGADPILIRTPSDRPVELAVRDSEGSFWFGQPNGVLRFRSDGRPPDTRFAPADTNLLRSDRLHLQAYAIDAFLPRGTRRDHTFSWRLDDGDWSAFGPDAARNLEGAKLATGHHRLAVRARDCGRDIDPTPAVLEFTVYPVPFQTRAWFLPVVIFVMGALAVTTFVAASARRKLAGHARWLEERVAQRTAELEQDIRERLRLEQQLSRLAAVAPGVLYVFRWRRDGSVSFPYVSPRISEILGLTPEQLAANPTAAESVLDPLDLSRLRDSIERCGHEGTNWHSEFRVRHPERGSIWVEGRAVPEREPDGSILWHGFFFEVTARHEAESERRRLEAQLERARRLEAVGTLASGIAHDFNNILGAILGNVALARQDVGAKHPAYESLEEIAKAGERAKRLVLQILAFARAQAPERQLLDLAPVIQESLDMLRSTLPPGVELIAHLVTRPPLVRADPIQIHQIMLNLCTNAAQALPPKGGRIEVTLQTLTLGTEDLGRAPGLHAGPHMILTVADNGHGMDGQTLARVFEPFFTTKDLGGGTGLGLSVVHGIVRSHGGVVHAWSEPGHGSRFEVYFPTSEIASAGPRPKPSLALAAPKELIPGAGRDLWFLDDDPEAIRLAERCLVRYGHRLQGFTDPTRMLTALRSASERCDALLVDWHMPGANGLDIGLEARQIRPGLRVLLFTGHDTPELAAAARQRGLDGILAKASSPEDIHQAVELLFTHPHPTS